MEDVIRRYGAREIYFDDDDFTANREHVHSLCEEIERRSLETNWSVMGDAMVTDETMLEAMAGAGCTGLKFGLESADREVLERIGKPLKLERVRRVVSKARILGIKTHLAVALGLPGETLASLDKTFEFVRQLDVDSIQFSIATPYPGTRFHRELMRENRIVASSWADYDAGNSSVAVYDDFSRQYLQELEATAWGRWLRYKLTKPRWLLRQARYLLRLLRLQGVGGLGRRLVRGLHLLSESSLTGFKYRGRFPIRR